jgi:hypothetical protein
VYVRETYEIKLKMQLGKLTVEKAWVESLTMLLRVRLLDSRWWGPKVSPWNQQELPPRPRTAAAAGRQSSNWHMCNAYMDSMYLQVTCETMDWPTLKAANNTLENINLEL